MMRFAGAAAACALSACVVSHVGHDESAEGRALRLAGHHSQLAFAYLAQDRVEVARREADSALRWYPAHVDALHARAMVEVMRERMPSALRYFALAMKALNDATPGQVPEHEQAAVLYENYASALDAVGRRDEADALMALNGRSARRSAQEGRMMR